MGDFVQQKLVEWNLGDYAEDFKKEDFDQEGFENITAKDVESIIKPRGAQRRFQSRHAEMMKQKQLQEEMTDPEQKQLVDTFGKLTVAYKGLTTFVAGSSKKIKDSVGQLQQYGTYGANNKKYLKAVDTHKEFALNFERMERKALQLVRATQLDCINISLLCDDVMKGRLSLERALQDIQNWTKDWAKELSEVAEKQLELSHETQDMQMRAGNFASQVQEEKDRWKGVLSSIVALLFTEDTSEEQQKMIDKFRATEECLSSAVGAVENTEKLLTLLEDFVTNMLKKTKGRDGGKHGENGDIPMLFLSKLQEEARRLAKGTTAILDQMRYQ